MFLANPDGGSYYLGFPGTAGTSGEYVNWSGGAYVLKLTAPEGKVFKGLDIGCRAKTPSTPVSGRIWGRPSR